MECDYSRVPHMRLSNGVCMPSLGLGNTHSGGYNHETVVCALRDYGYRNVDTARRYGTESLLAASVRESGVPRRHIFIGTKLWPTDFGFEPTLRAFEASCSRLDTDYLDLYLIHMPIVPDCLQVVDPAQLLADTWRAMEHLYSLGKCRAIGVSNYGVSDLSSLLSQAAVTPHVNQVEFNPYYHEPDLLHYCLSHNILLMGYCPLAKGAVLRESVLTDMAARHGKTPAQVCIRWSIQHGVPAIPKSTNRQRALQNTQVFDFELSESEMLALDGLRDPARKCCRLDDMQRKFRLPDGYKMAATTAYTPQVDLTSRHSKSHAWLGRQQATQPATAAS